jgi:hypothetical protein
MKLVGFNFTKIAIEKTGDSYKNLKLNTKMDIFNIDSVDSPFFKGEEDLIKVKFLYTIDYAPTIAKIELGGNILLGVEKTKSKGILEGWKEKKIPEDFRLLIFNLVLKKANVKALELEDQMGLPLHVPMPSLKKQKKE